MSSSQPEYPQRTTKADAKAAKKAYKASRPWYKKKRYLLPLALVALIVIVSVSNSGGSSNKSTPTASDNTSATESATPSQSASTKATPSKKVTPTKAAVKTYKMPNEVGKDLQTAQDDIQSVVGHFYVTDSKDASGQGRLQVLDSGWQVCSQSTPAGHSFTEDANITFNVVRVAETCPGAAAKTAKAKPKSSGPSLTMAQQQAIGSAKDYLSTQAFSRKGLIDQLKYESFSTHDATVAVDSIKVNYRVQAAKSAKDYLDTQHFSRQGLIDQLKYDGFTTAQATAGVNAVGL